MVFTALSAVSYTRTSATWDEPQHLTAGYAALVARDYRIDPEHPPLARLWAASPLLLMRPRAIDTRPIDAITPTDWVSGRLFDFSHRFLYVDNDADRVLYAARFMIVLLGVVLGILVFRWANAWLGFGAAAVAVAAYTFEPNLAAHASLVTSDFGVTCFIFGTAYFLWRTCRDPRGVHVAGLVAFFVAAQLTKYSAIVLAPVVVVTLTFAVVRMRTLRAPAAAAIVLVLAAATFAGIWTVYGFRYAPSATAGWLFAFHRDPVVIQRLPNLAAAIGWIDAHHLLPNAYSQGFLLGQAKAQVRDGFLAGQFSDRGWWYYFPVAFLIKTPIALILLIAGGLAMILGGRVRNQRYDAGFVLLPMLAYLASALITPLNIGLRHLLPIYPFAILIAAAAARALIARREGRVALAVLAACWLFEVGRVYPSNLAFFNQLVGGPRHGSLYLVDSNVDWGQDLKPLKGWMDAHGVAQVGLGYFGTADPGYYGLRYTPLPGTGLFAGGPSVPPQLPGYVAVSVTVLNGVYLDERTRAFYAPLRAREPTATVGYSINVYRVDRPWW